MKFRFTDGWLLGDFSAAVSVEEDIELKDGDKKPCIIVTPVNADCTLTLGLEAGDVALIYVTEDDAAGITIKNVEDDTGTELAAGDVVMVVASQTADATKVITIAQA